MVIWIWASVYLSVKKANDRTGLRIRDCVSVFLAECLACVVFNKCQPSIRLWISGFSLSGLFFVIFQFYTHSQLLTLENFFLKCLDGWKCSTSSKISRDDSLEQLRETHINLGGAIITSIVVVQSLSRVWPFATPGTTAGQASLSSTISWSFAQAHVHWVGNAI